jgi:protein-tyrosine phosphatase
MLQLAAPIGYDDIPMLFIPMQDGAPLMLEQLEASLAFIRDYKAAGHRVLVACGAAVSRSVLVAMATLMEHEGLALFEAYKAIYDQHPAANPNPDLVLELAHFCGLELDLLDVWDGLKAVQYGE